MQIEDFSFVLIRINGANHEHDVVIEGGKSANVRKSRLRNSVTTVGHTPLSVEEDIPWKCRRLVIGTRVYGKLPVITEVKREAKRRKVQLLIVPTAAAIQELRRDPSGTNAILHVTCSQQLPFFQ